MADLTEQQAAISVKITGSSTAGVEDNYVDADANGNLLVSNYANGPVTPGAVAPKSSLIGAQFNTSLPTLTTGQQVAMQVDSSGRLIVAPLTNSSVVKAQLQDNAGTAITLGQKTMASSMPMVIASDQTALPVSQSGTWTVQPGNTQNTTPWLVKDSADGTVGSAAPVTAIQAAGKNVAGNLQPLSLTRDGLLNVSTNSDKSVFGPLLVASRVQQLAADFSETLVNNNITQTVAGTGTVSLLNANATISTGTGTTASAQITTIGTIDYLPGREMYAQYTAAFTTPTSAASTQLTGFYNGIDGLLIGYNGLNFSIATVAGGASTFVASSSFNVDTLTGAATSLFTRAGVPEAVNFTFKNVYRIRAGWLGAAPIFYEIMSPDGNWVTFHIVRQPNSSLNPSFLEPSLPLTMLVTKTASDATNLKIVTTSWDAGVVDAAGQTDTSDSGTISALNGTTIITIESQSTVVANVTGTWVGTIQVQGDVGDGTWNAIYAINTNAVAAQTITANATLIIACAGFTSIRLIGTAWTSGTANVNWVASSGVQAIIAQVVGNIASGSPDFGNPIKMGGVYNATPPTVATGSRVDLQLDSSGRLLTSTAVTTSLPAATFDNQHVITNGTTIYTVFTASQKLALKQFYAGGTGIGKQALYSYGASTTQFVTFGDFESSGDVSNWTYTTNGGTGSLAFSTAQHFTGSGAMSLTFTTSDANHLNGAKQTFSSPIDVSGWRYINAEFYNTVSAGATYTRSISIILTDSNASTRTYLVSGSSAASPFNASGWVQILGEIVTPTSSTGTSFDVTSIVSLELRQSDSASRAGTVYWDTVRLQSSLTPLFPIYHQANTSFNVAIDPVFIMNTSDQIVIAQTNSDTSKQEYYAVAAGVSV